MELIQEQSWGHRNSLKQINFCYSSANHWNYWTIRTIEAIGATVTTRTNGTNESVSKIGTIGANGAFEINLIIITMEPLKL